MRVRNKTGEVKKKKKKKNKVPLAKINKNLARGLLLFIGISRQ